MHNQFTAIAPSQKQNYWTMSLRVRFHLMSMSTEIIILIEFPADAMGVFNIKTNQLRDIFICRPLFCYLHSRTIFSLCEWHTRLKAQFYINSFTIVSLYLFVYLSFFFSSFRYRFLFSNIDFLQWNENKIKFRLQ